MTKQPIIYVAVFDATGVYGAPKMPQVNEKALADQNLVNATQNGPGKGTVVITERGTSFGYHNLIVDMRAFPMMRAQGVPVVFDATHSLQLPGGGDGVTAGLAEYREPLASAGVAAGVDGVFLEVHDDPSRAKSDAQNALPLDRLEALLRRLTAIDAITKRAEAARGSLGATGAHG